MLDVAQLAARPTQLDIDATIRAQQQAAAAPSLNGNSYDGAAMSARNYAAAIKGAGAAQRFAKWPIDDLTPPTAQSSVALGPIVVTADELASLIKDRRLPMQMLSRINGEVWSDADGGDMAHRFGDFVERASRDSRIVPGDVFGTGTCGTGCCNELVGDKIPGRRWLEPGDVVELEVEGIGVLRNRVGPKLHPDLNETYRYRPVEPAPAGS